MMNMFNENLYMRCRVCTHDISEPSKAIIIFYKDFLDEKIRKYLYTNVRIHFDISQKKRARRS